MERDAQDLILWKRWKETGEERLLTRLLSLYEPMVVKYAKVVNRLDHSAYPDACQEGRLGALHAAHTYDPESGTLPLWIHVCIRKFLLNFWRRRMTSVRYTDETTHYLSQAPILIDRLTAQLGREPTDAELAREIGYTPGEMAHVRANLRASDPISIHNIVRFQSRQEECVHRLPAPREDHDTRLAIEMALETLSPRARALAQGLVEGYSGSDRAREQKVSRNRVYQLKHNLRRDLLRALSGEPTLSTRDILSRDVYDYI